MRVMEFDREYFRVAQAVLLGSRAVNRRTGVGVHQAHGVSIAQRGLPLLTLRDVRPRWSCAEAVWFMAGSRDPAWMEQFGFKAWSKFKDREGRVDSASGWRWRHAAGVDQLRWLVDSLKSDPTTRQGVLSGWLPAEDCWHEGASPRPKNVPCLPTWHFWLEQEDDGDLPQLHVSVFQRSCDIWYGLPADIAVISIVQAMLARHLEAEPGGVHLTISNAHLYDTQFDAMGRLLSRLDAAGFGGTSPNHRLALKRDLLPAAMRGEAWVVEDLSALIQPFYDAHKQEDIAGGGMAL